jgi:hypothetical protein
MQVASGTADRTELIDVPLAIRFRHHGALLGPTSLFATLSGERRELIVPVWSRDRTPFSIARVSCSLPTLQVQEFSPEAGARHEVVLAMAGEVDSPLSADEEATGHVEIFTDKWPDEPFRVNVVVLHSR